MRIRIESELEAIRQREKELDEREKAILTKETTGNDSTIRAEIRDFFEFCGSTGGNVPTSSVYQSDPSRYTSRLYDFILTLERLI